MHPRKMNLHEMVGKEYSTNDEAVKVCEEIKASPMKVDFRLLWELHQEFPDYHLDELIGYLEMNEVPMTDAVRKLGICTGILYA